MRFLTLCALIGILSPRAVTNQPDDFHMTVRDVFTITGMGVVMTGIVEGGPVAVEDVVCLRPAEGEQRELTVAGIIQAAEPGMAVGLRFQDIEKKDANAGDTLTADCD